MRRIAGTLISALTLLLASTAFAQEEGIDPVIAEAFAHTQTMQQACMDGLPEEMFRMMESGPGALIACGLSDLLLSSPEAFRMAVDLRMNQLLDYPTRIPWQDDGRGMLTTGFHGGQHVYFFTVFPETGIFVIYREVVQ